jgi:hypothetical protein
MPKLSLIIIVHNMARQAMNTIYSLSAQHQQNVAEQDYELIVIENRSAQCLNKQAVLSIGNNIRYLCRDETGVSPAAAINEGFRLAQAPFIGLMIDGARMVTPRVIEYALAARQVSNHSLTAIPSFNLGNSLQHLNLETGHNETTEQEWLEYCQWKHNGYRLFDFSCIGEANPRGVFQSFMESNCYFTSRENFAAIGYADEAFHFPGGGGLNLHMFRSIGMLPTCRHYCVTPGEGTFHQFHGGVSTSQREDREASFIPPRVQLESYWGNKPFQALEREPILLGAVGKHAQSFLQYSAQRGEKRFNRLHKQQQTFWRDDLTRAHFCEQAS